MSEVSNDDVVAIVGPIGDAAVAEIIGTGISKDELVAAHKRAVKDRKATILALHWSRGTLPRSSASLSGCIRLVCWANPDRL